MTQNNYALRRNYNSRDRALEEEFARVIKAKSLDRYFEPQTDWQNLKTTEYARPAKGTSQKRTR